MNCERCGKKKVTVFYRENIGGRVRSRRLCTDCAEILERAGELEEFSTAVSGFTSPLFTVDETIFHIPVPTLKKDGTTAARPTCRDCGVTAFEIVSTGKAGCAACYATFTEELSYLGAGLNGGGMHRGRVSAGYRVKKEKAERLAMLKKQLKDAVSAEKYEAAVEFRDAIRALEAEM